MLPHRKVADIIRYWSRHLNPEVSRSSWSKKDWEKIRKFASDYRPDQGKQTYQLATARVTSLRFVFVYAGLDKLYAKFPDRLAWTVKKYFLDIYTNVEEVFPTDSHREILGRSSCRIRYNTSLNRSSSRTAGWRKMGKDRCLQDKATRSKSLSSRNCMSTSSKR